VQGHPWSHKRVYRIYCELELNLRIKPRIRLKRDKPDALAVPDVPNLTWSMDFMADRLGDGRAFRLLNVLDRCTSGYCKAISREWILTARVWASRSIFLCQPNGSFAALIGSLNGVGDLEPFGSIMGRSISVVSCWNRLRSKVLASSTSNPESLNRTHISSAIIAGPGMNGWTNTSLKTSSLSVNVSFTCQPAGRHRASPHNGYGLTTMTARIWASAA